MENMAVYDTIRNEILRAEEARTSCFIQMYTLYISLFSIGIKFRLLFLASFIVLIVFQAMINREEWVIEKASAYIQEFFEKQYPDIHWEKLHEFEMYKKIHKKYYRRLGWFFYKRSSSCLAIISVCAMCTHILTYFEHSVNDCIVLMLSLILASVTIIINYSLPTEKDSKELESCMATYRKFCQNNKKRI